MLSVVWVDFEVCSEDEVSFVDADWEEMNVGTVAGRYFVDSDVWRVV